MPANPQEVEAQKAALLASIAQQGSAGQAAFQQETARRQEAQKAAIGEISQRSRTTGNVMPVAVNQQLQQQQKDLGSIYEQDTAMSNQAFNQSISNSSRANADYLSQAAAAVPIVNAQTQGTVAQIRAEQEEAAAERKYQAEQRVYEAQQRAIDAQEADKERAFTAKQREMEIQDRLTERQYAAEDRKLEDSGGLTELSDAVNDDRRRRLLLRAQNEANPVTATALSALTTAADGPQSLQEAMETAPRVINAIIAKAQGSEKGKKVWSHKDRLDLYKRLYDFYSDEGMPADANDLGDRLVSNGLSADQVPGYVPPKERKGGSTLTNPFGLNKRSAATAKSVAGAEAPLSDPFNPETFPDQRPARNSVEYTERSIGIPNTTNYNPFKSRTFTDADSQAAIAYAIKKKGRWPINDEEASTWRFLDSIEADKKKKQDKEVLDRETATAVALGGY